MVSPTPTAQQLCYPWTHCPPATMPERVLAGTVMGQNYARKHADSSTVGMTAKWCMSVVPGHVACKHSYKVCDTSSSLSCLPYWGTEPLSASRAVTAVASACCVQQFWEYIVYLVHKIPVGSSDPKNGTAARPGKGALQTSRQCPRALAAPLLILSVGDWVDSSREIQS